MKNSKLLAITIVTLIFSMSNAAFAKETPKSNVAVVDIQKIVQSSPEIAELNKSRKAKVTDLVSYVEKARAEISKETNATKKKTMEENYVKQINMKKETLDNEYIQSLNTVDKQISSIIKTKSAGYDLVLTKTSVINGGTDITDEIVKELK